MKRFILLFSLLSALPGFAQKIQVANLQLSIKAGSSEELYYAFDSGDKIIFNAEAKNGSIDEFSVIEFPENAKFRLLNLKKERKEIVVYSKAVYMFRLTNKSDKDISCTLNILRTPSKTGNRNFNTGVVLKPVQDTIWNVVAKDVLTGYDTIYTQKIRKITVSEKKYEEVVLDKSQRVSSKTTFGDSRTMVSFSLPKDLVTKEETKKVVAWAYWVGVGEESNEFWKQNRTMIVGAVKGVTTYFTTPLGGIAAGVATNLLLPTNGEDVEYALVNEANSKLFVSGKPFKSYDGGKGIAAYKRFTDADMLQGKFYMTLANDNYVQPIDVNVKVSAIIEHIRYKDEKYTETHVTPRYEKRLTKEPVIKTRNIPIPVSGK